MLIGFAAARSARSPQRLGLAAVLAELVLAAVAIVTFNVGGGTQFVTDRVWIPNLIGSADVHFHVAMDGLSLFMVALTAVGVASAVWTAIRAGRDRLSMYLGLLLLLEASLVTLFTARDLVLFYVGLGGR